jgi:hypothetical protein
VHSLTVSPQHRRRGIAYRLLKLIKKKAIDDCVSEQICVNNEIDADDFDVSLLMSLLTIDDCIFEEICVTNEIDADDFGVSLLAIDDVIFEYHERNVQRKKCARKSKSRRSRPKLRERVASGFKGMWVRGYGVEGAVWVLKRVIKIRTTKSSTGFAGWTIMMKKTTRHLNRMCGRRLSKLARNWGTTLSTLPSFCKRANTRKSS